MKKNNKKDTSITKVIFNSKGRKLEGKELEEHLRAFTDIEECIKELYNDQIKIIKRT